MRSCKNRVVIAAISRHPFDHCTASAVDRASGQRFPLNQALPAQRLCMTAFNKSRCGKLCEDITGRMKIQCFSGPQGLPEKANEPVHQPMERLIVESIGQVK
jgi:hypothetical protein